jgi:imidazolonepropionase-like amidohydrolase
MRSFGILHAMLVTAFAVAGLAVAPAAEAFAQEEAEREPVKPAPPRAEGEGPFERLIIRGATLIDGTGAPPRGPVDIVVEGNRIAAVRNVGVPHVAIDPKKRPTDATKEIDAHGKYVLPGFVDLHIHTGGVPKAPEAEYMYKLWMAHGITTTRGVPFGALDWSLSEKDRSARNEITAPRMFSYHRPGSGRDRPILTPEDAREWVRWAAKKGIDGLKLRAERPEIMAALLDEAKKLGLGSTAHLAQTGVAQMNAPDAARLGLGAVTHYYGLFEALYRDHDVQPYPVDYNYNDEQHRFGQVARQWDLIHPQGSPEWNALIQEFLKHRLILDPTMTAYLASRDVMRARNADWMDEYVLPSLWDFYQPSRENHGSYYYDWTTWDEVAWKNFYRVWMAFLDDYNDAGGRVTVSSDAGFIYNLYGFSTIEEMELLQEAGFHPLEVIRSATLYGAEAIFEPKGRPIEFGVVRPGLLADLVVVGENPIANLKVLYGTGTVRLNDETRRPERVGGVLYTIKDGIVYDAKQLLADLARMVERQKVARGIVALPQIEWAATARKASREEF